MSNPYARTYQTTTSDRAARKALIQSALQQNQQLQQLIKTQDDVDILTEILGQMNMGQMNMGQMNMGQMNNMNNMDMSKGGKSRLRRRSLKRRSLKRRTTRRRR